MKSGLLLIEHAARGSALCGSQLESSPHKVHISRDVRISAYNRLTFGCFALRLDQICLVRLQWKIACVPTLLRDHVVLLVLAHLALDHGLRISHRWEVCELLLRFGRVLVRPD